jgi:hypothetical protein
VSGSSVIGAPAKEDAQVGLAVLAGQAAVATEVGRYRGSQDKLTRGLETGAGNTKLSHVLRWVTSGDERQHSRRSRCVHGPVSSVVRAYCEKPRKMPSAPVDLANSM